MEKLVMDWESVKAVDMEVDIAIAGGGLAGLALAVGLSERGIEAHVFEKAPALRTDSATAISMALNSMRAADGLKPGLAKEMEEMGLFTEVDLLIRNNSGPDMRIPVDHKKGEFFMLGWRFCQEVLARYVKTSKTHCNHRFLTYKAIPGGVLSQFLLKDEGDSTTSGVVKVVKSKLLVGADGLWSAVRSVMIGDAPRYLNFLNWNAMEYTPKGKVFNYDEGHVYMIHQADESALGYISDVGRGYCLWLLRIKDEDGKLAEDLLARSKEWDKSLSKQRALEHMSKLETWRDVRSAIESTDANSIYERRSMDRCCIDKWSDESGRVILFGDAAHAMYSALGMGARSAFEDAHQLTLALEEAMEKARKGEDEGLMIEEAVRRFEEVRVGRVNRCHAYAAELTEQECFQPKWVRDLSRKERAIRLDEFINWTCQYPNNMAGDPNSTYWKP